jgi:hypothetical protein
VVGVGSPVGRLHRAPVGGAGRLVLGDQVPQVVLPDDGEHHPPHGVVGPGQRRVGDPEQQPFLALDPLERVDQLGGDPPLGPRPDPVHGRDQQGHQRVGDLPPAAEQQRRQQRHLQVVGMVAEVAGRLGHRLVAPLLQHPRRHIPEQVFRKAERADRRQLAGLGEHRRQADRARSRLDHPQQVRVLILDVITGADQREEPGDALPGQPARDPARQKPGPLEQRRAHVPVDLIRGRRLQLPDPALAQELLPDHVVAALALSEVTGERLGELLSLGLPADPEPEVPADLAVVPLDAPP